MLLIIAHHYVVNSGLYQIIVDAPLSASSAAMLLFGAWGKTGINCFVLITGYFMCRSTFSLQKFFRLYLKIVFYSTIIYVIFCFAGKQNFAVANLMWTLWPIKSIGDGFTSCFLIFFLFIPYLNVLVHNLTRHQHKLLIMLLLSAFSVLPTFWRIHLSFNYVGWFCVLYVVASYLRMYDVAELFTAVRWGVISVVLLIIGSLSVIGLYYLYKIGQVSLTAFYFFISDSNKILSLAIAITSFMYFRRLNVKPSRYINLVGASTFGIFLIHTDSDMMRHWLWCNLVDCVGHHSFSVFESLGYATITVLTIFTVCSLIDIIRDRYIQQFIFSCYNHILSKRAGVTYSKK